MSIKIFCSNYQIPFTKLVFPGGEVQVKVTSNLTLGVPFTIQAFIKNSEDLMTLFLITDALRGLGVRDISLQLPYIPYARQDRVCNEGEALSVKVFSQLINAQEYTSVSVQDAHSDVAVALLDRCYNRPARSILKQFLPLIKPFILRDSLIFVAPDAGSIKKVAEASKELAIPFIRADKTRDVSTGKITGTVVYSEPVGDTNFLIVDDICDGGRTFLELAKGLRPLTTGKVYLYITHGIFSQGLTVFDGVIDHVFVMNSFVDNLPSNFTCFTNT